MQNKPTLLFINGNQFGYSAGHFFYCKYLKKDFDIYYLCFDRNRVKMGMEGVNVQYVSFKGNVIVRLARFLIKGIKFSHQLSPSYLFVVYFNLCFTFSLFCKAKQKIVDIRTGSIASSSLKRKIDNRWIQLQSFLFEKRIILSDSLKSMLGIITRKTLVFPLGAETFYQGDHSFSENHLIYVGLLDRRNIHETIDGLAFYLNKFPDEKRNTKYTIVGWGNDNTIAKIKNSIEKTGLQDIVKLEGRKNYSELPEYFANANIGIAYVPIVDYYQNQPVTKIYEYMLSGIPVIATATYENRLVMKPQTGVLCEDNAHSFSKALEELKTINYNSDGIREIMKDYHWENLVKKHLKSFIIS